MKLKDIFKLNLSKGGGNIKLTKKILDSYRISKDEKKDLINEFKNKNDNKAIEIKFYKIKLTLDILPNINNVLITLNNGLILYIDNVVIQYPFIALCKVDNSYIFDTIKTMDRINSILENPYIINNIDELFYNGEIYLGLSMTGQEYIEKRFLPGEESIENYKIEYKLDKIATPITEQEYLNKLYDVKIYTLEDLQ